MGWFLVNIVVPLLAPVFILCLLRPLPLPAPARTSLKWITPVKDGQLCWVAITFCASALHEYGTAASQFVAPPAALLQVSNGLANVCLVMSSIVAAGGALYPTSAEKQMGVSWVRHFSCFCVSLFFALASAFLYAIIHFGMS
ncbi:hypothetical protein [Pseudoduganella sp. OTU4001]|uniref:hypothetical protein n=1 Tax=Pseudoduganella sp. OTU4001 TaxID=3043854 RepID=UPI00313E4D4C